MRQTNIVTTLIIDTPVLARRQSVLNALPASQRQRPAGAEVRAKSPDGWFVVESTKYVPARVQ